MDATEALRRIQNIVLNEPELQAIREDGSYPPETLKWLGNLQVMADIILTNVVDRASLRIAIDKLVSSGGLKGDEEIRALMYRVLASAEYSAPISEQGSFIAAGAVHDAYAAISRVLSTAQTNLLIVDPYMDGKALTDFMISAQEGVSLQILSDEAFVKPTLGPAAKKWADQYGDVRSIQVRLTQPRTLHDRLIIVDSSEAWILTQSLKDFAARAHSSLLKSDTETAELKIAAYNSLWNQAQEI